MCVVNVYGKLEDLDHVGRAGEGNEGSGNGSSDGSGGKKLKGSISKW
jgi:hypothetical protein